MDEHPYHAFPGHGSVEVVAGCMDSGKGLEVLRRVRMEAGAGRAIAWARPPGPDRALAGNFDPATIQGVTVLRVAAAEDVSALLPRGADVVVLDGVQFFDRSVVRVARTLASRGLRVICVGLDTDFRGRAFREMANLLAEADHTCRLRGICAQCGGGATRTQRLRSGDEAPSGAYEPTICGADRAHYEARCRTCHMVPESA